MRRLLFVLGLLLLAAPADAVPTWRLLAPKPFGESFGFGTAAVESEGQGRIFFHWTPDTYLFNPVTNVWELQPALHGTTRHENNGSDWDETNNIFWIGNCTPCGSIDGVVVDNVTSALLTYNPATFIYTNTTPTNPGGGCGGDAADVWFDNALYCFGGYNGLSGDPLRRKITSPDGPWTTLAPANQPVLYIDQREASQYTMWRGGVNRAQSYLWMVAARNELYKCPIVAQNCTAWVHVPTAGVNKPTSLWVLYALDESRNKIVGWVGCDEENACNNPPLNQTYVLDLTTNVWSLGPGPNDPHPVGQTMPTHIPLYDRVRQRVLWLTNSGLWWYEDDGTGPPAGTPPTAPSKPDRHPQ
jgi:hypothetical protein